MGLSKGIKKLFHACEQEYTNALLAVGKHAYETASRHIAKAIELRIELAEKFNQGTPEKDQVNGQLLRYYITQGKILVHLDNDKALTAFRNAQVTFTKLSTEEKPYQQYHHIIAEQKIRTLQPSIAVQQIRFVPAMT